MSATSVSRQLDGPLNGGSPSQNEVVRCLMAFVWAVGLHGNSLAALRSVRRPVFWWLFFSAHRWQSSGPHSRRLQRHVLVLSFSRASIGNPCSASGEYGNHRNLDRPVSTCSVAAPVNISPPGHGDLLLAHWPALSQRGRHKTHFAGGYLCRDARSGSL